MGKKDGKKNCTRKTTITTKTEYAKNTAHKEEQSETTKVITDETIEEEQLSLKEIRETFYNCRDFEIKSLWHKSVFLFGFILACFTGYGTILIALLTTGEQKVAYPNMAHLVECVISLVGIVFSVIWIMMAKGSKAWYEIYEKAIGMIEGKDKNSKVYINIPDDYQMGKYCKQYAESIDDGLCSTKGGRYSPSKINVVIGQFLFVVWFLCFLIHLGSLLCKSCFFNFEWIKDCIRFVYKARYDFYPVIVLVFAYFTFIIILIIISMVKSSSIQIKYNKL